MITGISAAEDTSWSLLHKIWAIQSQLSIFQTVIISVILSSAIQTTKYSWWFPSLFLNPNFWILFPPPLVLSSIPSCQKYHFPSWPCEGIFRLNSPFTLLPVAAQFVIILLLPSSLEWLESLGTFDDITKKKSANGCSQSPDWSHFFRMWHF